MKRLLVLALVVFGFGAATFAGNNSSTGSFISKMNNERTFDGIASYLGVNFDQKDVLHYIFTEAERRMELSTRKGVSAEDAAQKAIYFNLGNAKRVLSNDQYVKLVCIVNLTINNERDYELFAEK